MAKCRKRINRNYLLFCRECERIDRGNAYAHAGERARPYIDCESVGIIHRQAFFSQELIKQRHERNRMRSAALIELHFYAAVRTEYRSGRILCGG